MTTIREARTREPAHGRSRLQDAWTDDNVHELEGKPWVRGAKLPDVPPRPGFRNRWVRIALLKQDDPGNVEHRYNQGWRPRNPDTLPKGLHIPTIGHGEWTGCIGSEGSVLMEIPEKRAKQIDSSARQVAERNTNGIADLLAQNAADPRAEITQKRESFSRAVKVQEDDE